MTVTNKKKLWTLAFIAVMSILTIKISEAQNMKNENNDLTMREQQIIPIAAFTAKGDLSNLKSALNQGLDNGLTVNEIKEILVQMYAYAGFPRSLNGISTFMEVMQEREQKGIKDQIGEEGKPLADDVNKRDYGNKVQMQLTGSEVKGGAMDFAPAIDSYLKEHLFADIFARGVLDFKDREIATISALASIEGVQAQLQSHMNIGMNVGITQAQMEQLIFVLNEKVGKTDASNAQSIFDKVLKSKKD